MTVYAYGSRASWEPIVRALVGRLDGHRRRRGLTYQQLARRIDRHPSTVSRLFAVKHFPARETVRRVAHVVGADTTAAMRLWEKAAAARQASRQCRAEGGPPDGLSTAADFRHALQALLASRGLTHRELARRDTTGLLKRSTVGAVLRGERGAREDVVMAIVDACGASSEARDAWQDAWRDLARPDRVARLIRQEEGYRRLQRARAFAMTGRWMR